MARLLLALLLALALVPMGGCGKDDDAANDDDSADDDDSATAEKEEDDERVPVRTEALVRGPISERIATSATVDSDQRADILVEANGTVESIGSIQTGTFQFDETFLYTPDEIGDSNFAYSELSSRYQHHQRNNID